MANSISTADITFCIKTIHRPWSCHRLVESLRERIPNPNIVVVDDGRHELRFSEKYPETAGHCTVINLEQHDVGVGVGRNAAIDAATTEYIFLLDDDHVATESLHFDRVCEYFATHDLDILAVRQGNGGRPTMLSPLMNGKRIWMHRGEYQRLGTVAWCDMVSNAFLARKETIATLRWDEQIKTYEHWEFFYRASHVANLQIAVAIDCAIHHAHVTSKSYRNLRARSKFRAMGLRKHGFHSMRYPGGQIVRA
ncbi:glycosyltransferase family 2 protein [Stieleria marina]|uniref:Putative glycosyl transferase n=1 Tax=Stieleria marina TaxID=1930275 RepID=A0A517NUF8_9BACT|nr:putative glycosyl transferase [Planctomycetes bacterium K23_9]